jgi:hypothetical protein
MIENHASKNHITKKITHFTLLINSFENRWTLNRKLDTLPRFNDRYLVIIVFLSRRKSSM